MARGWALVAVCVVLLDCAHALSHAPRRPVGLEERKWGLDARQTARSGARAFLESSGSELLVPLDVEVFLIGFDGDGGYAHKQDAQALLALVAAGLNQHCPHSLATEEQLGVCFQLNWQVLSSGELGDPGSKLLRGVEGHLRAHLRDASPSPLGKLRNGAPDGNAPGVSEYITDAEWMEPFFDEFLEYAYGERTDEEAKGHNWHHQNPIIIINPSKVRLNPRGRPEDVSHTVPDFLFQWHNKSYASEDLEREEAGFTYRYAYKGAGEATAWLSSRNYLVIDVSAGPTAFGPAASRSGAVTDGTMPALRDVYRAILSDLREVGPSLSAQEHAAVVAQHAQRALFEGQLAATVVDAARALFVPDVADEHVEYAAHLLVPVVLLTDYELTDDDHEHRVQQEDFMHVNLTYVEQSLGRLLDEEQDAVVISAHHALSEHKPLMAALWKARRTRTEPAATHGERLGMHTVSHTSIDPEVLIEELAEAADGLTHGLTGAAHAMSKAESHPLEQLRHDGTRVVPVFVISLMQAPDDIMFANREMVVANHDIVIVLQLRQSAQWGGVADQVNTGHVANGRRVMSDSRSVTRHVIAGLAQAVAGIVPPYYRPRTPGTPEGRHPKDWRWAVGATPFGPYSAFDGVSEIMQNQARRNLLLSHISAALRAAQGRLDEFDALVERHYQGPWARVGIEGGKEAGRRHFLDTVASTRHGFQSGITEAVVGGLEGKMEAATRDLEDLGVELYAHDFPAADKVVNDRLLPNFAKLVQALDVAMGEARAVVACCRAVQVSAFGKLVKLLVLSAGGFTLVFAVGIALALVSARARRRSAGGLMLPTTLGSIGAPGGYGRPSSRQQSWTL